MITKQLKITITLFLFAFSYLFSADENTISCWHTRQSQIIKPNGEPIVLKSVSWFGFETQNKVVHGLWNRNMEELLNQIKDLGFNSIRLPFSNDILKSGATPDSINFYANPNLQDKTALEVFDYFIHEASKRGLYLILDRHRPTSAQQSELWYTQEVSENKWIEDWVFLATRYKKNAYVIGCDLHNEPNGSARWGNGDPATDWKAAAERAGNAILKANPNLLIVVEGIQYGKNGDAYWWGGTLDQIRELPVELSIPNKVVYSPHDYGAGVWKQTWFDASNFPHNMNAIWDEKWGYIAKENIAPIWIGEFGGREVGYDTKEGLWQNKLVEYLYENGMSYAYWCLNPNSGDTGGILSDDWKMINQGKIEMLQPILLEFGGSPRCHRSKYSQNLKKRATELGYTISAVAA